MTSINPARAVERCERLARLGPPPSPRRGHPWKLTKKLKLWLREYRAIMALDITQCAEMMRGLYSSEYLRQMAERASPLGQVLRMAKERPSAFVAPVDCGKALDDA